MTDELQELLGYGRVTLTRVGPNTVCHLLPTLPEIGSRGIVTTQPTAALAVNRCLTSARDEISMALSRELEQLIG